MKATIFAAVALALSAASYAAEPNSGEAYQSDIHFVSTKTRAEVKAETLAALQRGEVIAGESYPFNLQPQTAPARTRADVKAELAHAKQAGALRNEH